MKVLTLGERLGSRRTYLRRWCLNLGVLAFRIHHWLGSDDSRAFHNHPWWYLTFVLAGGYWDVSPVRAMRMGRWSVRFFGRDHWHWVKVDPEGCWTFMVTGPRTRGLEFWDRGRGRPMKANKYFLQHGEHS